jgi:hypothetical protein
MAKNPTAGRAPANARAAAAPAADRPEFSATASRQPVVDDSKANDGKRGPKSALEGGNIGTAAGEQFNSDKAIEYSVQVHSDEEVGGLKRGLQVLYVTAKSGDEAALKVREAHKANYGVSIRGVTPASDPDANSMGGERDAAIMLANAESGGEFAPVQTEANAKAVEKLGKADIEDLGE